MLLWGAFSFGLVIGWITYRTIRRNQTNGLSDIATILGAVGGAAVTSLFPSETDIFGGYCFGLAVGFFAYLFISWRVVLQKTKNPELQELDEWLGADPKSNGPRREVPR